MSRSSKKIVLFIVEGITDEISLGLVLSRIIERNRLIKFKIINGDITTEIGTSQSNIVNRITKVIKDFISKDIYRKSDIDNVIHLVDTDGVFIDDSLVLNDNNDYVEYDTNFIYAKNRQAIIHRNKQKSQVLNKLMGTSIVYTDLPYHVYYFSSNLEHVLHNKQNALKTDKDYYARLFENKFAEEPLKFIDFINNNEIAVVGNYKETWDFIRRGTNSLNRHTNFHLFINSMKDD